VIGAGRSVPVLTRHADVPSFLVLARPLLQRSREVNSGVLAWLDDLAAGRPSDRAATDLLTVCRAGRATGVAFRADEGALVLGDSMPSAASRFARRLAADGARVPGVVGARATCRAFARTWHACTGASATLRFHFCHYTLARLRPPFPVRGTARPARSDETDMLTAWAHAFTAEARLVDDRAKVRARIEKRIGEQRLWVWDDDGPRAMLGYLATAERAVRIAPVYTPPEWRRHGYAAALVAAAISALQTRGVRTVDLAADLANPVSNRLYRRLGFIAAGEQYQYDLSRPHAR
jgi:predicted GNAT family acetyltransferase